MIDLLGPSLVLSGFGLYMASNVWLGRFRRRPWGFLAISALGGVLAVARAISMPSSATFVAAVVTVTMLGALYWFFFSFSMYARREDRPRVGETFPSFALPASDGSLYDSSAQRPRRRLYIFYRGSW